MKSKSCECCMMPLSKDPKRSGSDKYCSFCFSKGKLLAEGMTLRDFKDRSYHGMVESGQNKLVAWFLSRMIGFAPYWKGK